MTEAEFASWCEVEVTTLPCGTIQILEIICSPSPAKRVDRRPLSAGRSCRNCKMGRMIQFENEAEHLLFDNSERDLKELAQYCRSGTLVFRYLGPTGKKVVVVRTPNDFLIWEEGVADGWQRVRPGAEDG